MRGAGTRARITRTPVPGGRACDDEPPSDPRFFDPKRFFRKHKLNERIKELEAAAREEASSAAPAPAPAPSPSPTTKRGFRKGFLK